MLGSRCTGIPFGYTFLLFAHQPIDYLPDLEISLFLSFVVQYFHTVTSFISVLCSFQGAFADP